MEPPNVATKLKFGEFTFQVLAYRKLTKTEIDLSVAKYLQDRHIKAFPKKGSATLITSFGAFDG